ncbi:MAG: hypothetical protein EA423_03595 [Phycisphaerales bacterium]|nr:MAG: hypothetical protein EA423_03595 [Phycisphaerales bacterium]
MTRKRTARRGLTIIEAVMSVMVTSIVLVAAMETLGLVARSRSITERHSVGVMLAEDLLAEVLSRPFDDPGTLSPIEGKSGSRASFVSIADYHAWRASPPQDITGDELTAHAAYERRVTVTFVDDDLNPTASDTGVKLITVEVFRGSFPAAKTSALRTRGFDTAARATGGGS